MRLPSSLDGGKSQSRWEINNKESKLDRTRLEFASIGESVSRTSSFSKVITVLSGGGYFKNDYLIISCKSADIGFSA